MASKTSKYIARDQVFDCVVLGLMPLTRHYVYFENILVPNTNIQPNVGKIGEPVVTDSSGTLAFKFYYNGGTVLDTTPFEEAQSLATKLVSAKQLVVANKSVASLPADYRSTYLSYAVRTIDVNVTTEPTTETPAAIYKTVEVPWDGPPAYVYEPAPIVPDRPDRTGGIW